MHKKIFKSLILLLFIFGTVCFYKINFQSFSLGETRLLAGNNNSGGGIDANCNALLGNPGTTGTPAYYLQTVLDIIKYAGIVLCIVLTIVDFFNALTNDDKDLLKPLTKKALMRIIYAVMLFFLPIIVKMVLTLIDVYSTCGIS